MGNLRRGVFIYRPDVSMAFVCQNAMSTYAHPIEECLRSIMWCCWWRQCTNGMRTISVSNDAAFPNWISFHHTYIIYYTLSKLKLAYSWFLTPPARTLIGSVSRPKPILSNIMVPDKLISICKYMNMSLNCIYNCMSYIFISSCWICVYTIHTAAVAANISLRTGIDQTITHKHTSYIMVYGFQLKMYTLALQQMEEIECERWPKGGWKK